MDFRKFQRTRLERTQIHFNSGNILSYNDDFFKFPTGFDDYRRKKCKNTRFKCAYFQNTHFILSFNEYKLCSLCRRNNKFRRNHRTAPFTHFFKKIKFFIKIFSPGIDDFRCSISNFNRHSCTNDFFTARNSSRNYNVVFGSTVFCFADFKKRKF